MGTITVRDLHVVNPVSKENMNHVGLFEAGYSYYAMHSFPNDARLNKYMTTFWMLMHIYA